MFNNVKISTRLWIISGLSASLFLASLFIGYQGLDRSRASLKTVFDDRAVPLKDLQEISFRLEDNYSNLLRAIQHDPDGKVSSLHDHTVSKHRNEVTANKGKIDDLWNKYLATYLTPEEKLLAADFDKKRNQWVALFTQTLEKLMQSDFSKETVGRFLKEGRELRQEAQDALQALINLQLDVANQEYQAAEKRYQSALIWFALLALGGFSLMFGTTWATIRKISHALNNTSTVLEAISQGDLRQEVPAHGADEIGRMLDKLNLMRGNLRELVGSIHDNSNKLNNSAAELADAAQNSARISERQSESAFSMAASVEELSASVDQVEGFAKEAHGITEQSSTQSAQGGKIIHEAASEMKRIAEAVNSTAGTIRELEDFSGQISNIVGEIRDIADQTNLLALNAAIEAARAGEQGRGFAVVADEVRNLAGRTANSTKEIAETIDKIQKGTARAVLEMQSGVTRVTEGVNLAHQAGDSVIGIRAGSDQVLAAVDNIVTALREQATATRDISSRVEGIAQATEHNSASVTQTAASASEMRLLANDLYQVANRFKL